MLLTEEQAATTWCPRLDMRAAQHLGVNPPPGTTGVEHFSCIGSQCMAWRWKADPDVVSGAHLYVPIAEKWSCKHCKGTGGVLSPDDAAFTRDCHECEGEGEGVMKSPVGYCGLSGRVELLR